MWSNWRNEYPTAESRQRLAEQVESGGLAFTQVVFGPARDVDQFPGHVEWRALGLDPLLLGLFIVIAATGATRGVEERGDLEVLLTVPRSRMRLLAEQAGGLALALLVACGVVLLAVLVSGPAAGEPVVPARAAAVSVLNLGLAAAIFGALGLLLAQLVRARRTAATIAGAALIAAHVWANLGLVATSLEGWRWLSPLYLYSRSSPLATGEVSLAALAFSALGVVICATAAGWLFTIRDLGAPIRLPVPSVLRTARLDRGAVHRVWLLGNGFQRGLRSTLGSASAWGLGLAVLAVSVTAATPSIRSAFEQLPETQEAVERLEFQLSSDSGILSSLLFLLLPFLVAFFGVTLASAFAGEEQAGRLELELASPVPRRRYFVGRVAAGFVAIAIVVALTAVAFLGTAGITGVDLSWGRATFAALLLTLPAAVVAAFGYAVAAWRPSIVTPAAGAALAVSFFFDLLAPALDLPEPIRKLSVFELYGRPLLEGVDWADVGVMLALIVGFVAAGSTVFGRRDILK